MDVISKGVGGRLGVGILTLQFNLLPQINDITCLLGTYLTEHCVILWWLLDIGR
jgi:hypothetical protein